MLTHDIYSVRVREYPLNIIQGIVVVIVCSTGVGKSILGPMVDNTGFTITVIVCGAGIGKSSLLPIAVIMN